MLQNWQTILKKTIDSIPSWHISIKLPYVPVQVSLCPDHFVVLAMFAVILHISKIISGHVQVLLNHKPCYCNCDWVTQISKFAVVCSFQLRVHSLISYQISACCICITITIWVKYIVYYLINILIVHYVAKQVSTHSIT